MEKHETIRTDWEGMYLITVLSVIIIFLFILMLIAAILLIVGCVKKKKGKKAKPYFISFGVIAGLLFGVWIFQMVYLQRILYCSVNENEEGTPYAVISGADGPTSVFLAGKLGDNDEEKKVKLQKKEKLDTGISTLPLDIIVEVEDYEDGYLFCNLSNQSGYAYCFGEEYGLEKKSNGEWVKLDPIEDYGWTDIEIVVEDLEEMPLTYDLSFFGELEAGEYRLIIDNDLYAEFTLVEE